MKLKINFLILIVPLCGALAGCALEERFEPQFEISDLVYKTLLNESDNYTDKSFLPEGIYFTFLNKADKKVIFIETKMNLFDRKTSQPAFLGTGTLTFQFDGIINPKTSIELCVPFEDFIKSAMNMELFIDSFYISRIVYEDGTEWFDLFGSYSVKEGGN